MDKQTSDASGHRKETDSFDRISSVLPNRLPQLNDYVHEGNELKKSQSNNTTEFGNSDQSTNRDGFIIKAEPKKETPEFEEIEKLSRTRTKVRLIYPQHLKCKYQLWVFCMYKMPLSF